MDSLKEPRESISTELEHQNTDVFRAANQLELSSKVGVVGVGFLGEALVRAFSVCFHVIGVEISSARAEKMRAQLVDQPFPVDIVTDPTLLGRCDLVCVAVPTPIKDGKVDLTYVTTACQTVAKCCKPGTIVVIESSVPVGGTRMFLGALRSSFYIGFSPNRIDPGRVEPSYVDTKKIVSGMDKESLERINSFYERAFSNVIRVSSMETAEMCKLYENCFRMVNIAYVNEIADACTQFGIDPVEMIHASATKNFGFMPFFPSVGVGGTCIPISPHYIMTNCHLPLLDQATKAMAKRPSDFAEYLTRKYPACKRVLALGLGYKPGEGVVTQSPFLQCTQVLSDKGWSVHWYDPHVGPARVRDVKITRVAKPHLDQEGSCYDAVLCFHQDLWDEVRGCKSVVSAKHFIAERWMEEFRV